MFVRVSLKMYQIEECVGYFAPLIPRRPDGWGRGYIKSLTE